MYLVRAVKSVRGGEIPYRSVVSGGSDASCGLIILRRRGIEWKEVGLKRPSREDIPLAFRGVILHRLRVLFGSGRGSDVTAAGVQAVWFGLGHSSQGAAGMALTGLMGFGLALFFLWRAEESLTPLVLAHGAINTIVLTINYLAPAAP